MLRFNYKERSGVLKAGMIFTEDIQWVYRDQPLVDVGIDALIEEAINGNPTGKFLAAQIKSGKGNVHEKEDSFTYYISRVHQGYWLNLAIPIVIILYVQEDNLVYWEIINNKTITKTSSKWKIEIPKTKVLGKHSITELSKIIQSDIQNDFLSQYINNEVSKEEIERISNASENLNILTEIILQITKVMNNMKKVLVINTNRMKYYTSKKLSNKNREVKNSMADVSQIMNKSSREINTLINNFSNKFADTFIDFEKVIIIYLYETKDYTSLENVYDSINKLDDTIRISTKTLIALRRQVSAFPTEYPNLANARGRTIDSCNSMIEEFKVSSKMSNKLSQWLYEKIY
ncbi:DUF4365 domain-containing protein [Bernardetia sp.]|uniref:DUF4365 domain-containing protein n=1 Tax=Bernardetia sp. TaxID=1937974 RepID=UPI0025BAF633|nr:DUF4365 domain-containing protein [Bernardetia sp.]